MELDSIENLILHRKELKAKSEIFSKLAESEEDLCRLHFTFMDGSGGYVTITNKEMGKVLDVLKTSNNMELIKTETYLNKALK